MSATRKIIISRESYEAMVGSMASLLSVGKIDGTRELADGRYEVSIREKTFQGLAAIDPDPETAMVRMFTDARDMVDARRKREAAFGGGMRHRMVISAEAEAMIRAGARHGQIHGARRLDDGRYEIELDSDVFSRLAAIDADPEKAIRKAFRQRGVSPPTATLNQVDAALEGITADARARIKATLDASPLPLADKAKILERLLAEAKARGEIVPIEDEAANHSDERLRRMSGDIRARQGKIDRLNEKRDRLLRAAGPVHRKAAIVNVRHRFADGRALAIFPAIEVVIPTLEKDYAFPRHLRLAADPIPGGRVRVWALGVEPNEPMPTGMAARRAAAYLEFEAAEEEWAEFERLWREWDYWFLRLAFAIAPSEGGEEYGDVQITGVEGEAFPQKKSIETSFEGDLLFKETAEGAKRFLARELFSIWRAEERSPIEWDIGRARRMAADHIRAFEATGGPLPWSRWSEGSGADPHATIVALYLRAQEAAAALAVGKRHLLRSSDGTRFELPRGASGEQDREAASRLWALLRRARIFELTPEAYGALHREADIYTVEKVAGGKWIAPRPAPSAVVQQQDEEEARRYMEAVNREGPKVPFPARMPFEVCYLAWGRGVTLTSAQLAAHLAGAGIDLSQIADLAPGVRSTMFAWMMTAEGDVIELHWITAPGGAPPLLWWFVHRDRQMGWTRPFFLAPWILPAAVAALNDHRTVRIEEGWTASEGRRHAAAGADGPPERRGPPPPYYVVRMRSDVVRSSSRRALVRGRPVEWHWRWRVRGHDMIRVRRGPLPIPDKWLKYLVAEGFDEPRKNLFFKRDEKCEADSLTVDDALAKKGRLYGAVPEKRPDEWMVVRASWYKDAVKGPGDRPLIESVLRPTEMPE